MIISINSKAKKYHADWCPYTVRMDPRYKRKLMKEAAEERGYTACSWCGGVHGTYLVIRNNEKMYPKVRKKIRFSYDRSDNGICLRTDIGFWKVIKDKNEQNYKLYHLNRVCFDADAADQELMKGIYHRQADVKATNKLGNILDYVYEHDKAKQIIEEDGYRKLPTSTKKQKRYFKSAKKKARKQQQRRVDEIFKQLEIERSKANG